MNTYPLLNRNGGTFGFEIENVYIGKRKIAMLLGTIQGVTDVRVRKLFSKDADIHVGFTYMAKLFMVWEPYGDSSKYWICPKDEAEANENIDVSALESVFQQYRPPLVIKVLGDLVSLKFLTPFKSWFKFSRRG